jgi:hypothetical protein
MNGRQAVEAKFQSPISFSRLPAPKIDFAIRLSELSVDV